MNYKQYVFDPQTLRDHWDNFRHNATVREMAYKFGLTFFKALGWSLGLIPLALVVGPYL